jgi:tyrosyl-tRNA synthetase
MDTTLEYVMRRAVAEVIIEEQMVELLKSGKKLRLKEGFDPSSPDIHLGHMVTLRKLRQFQELGHQIVLIVADWTARIGDPSGMSATRAMLSKEQVLTNANTYMEQFFNIVDKDKTEIRWQSEWFDKFTLTDVINLTSRFTVAQFLAREDFSNRFNAGRPIAITELLYPLLQAYDSVAIEADVEFGGLDQKFNFLVGRELMSMMGQPPQQCFMTPLLVGTDGSQKMSKSLGNYIGITEPPNDIYGKAMSVRDDLILQYFELVTDVPDRELAEFKQALEHDEVNPMELKKRLAREIIIQLYDQKAAVEAEGYFSKVVQEKDITVSDSAPLIKLTYKNLESEIQKKEIPEEIRELRIFFKDLSPQQMEVTGVYIPRLLMVIGFAKSISEANRLIAQGAVSIDGEKILGNSAHFKIGSIIKVGKRRFARVILTDRETK